jgi:hypothetical protein
MDERFRNIESLDEKLGNLSLGERISILDELGKKILQSSEKQEAIIYRAYLENKWFTVENQKSALEAIATEFLNKEKLENWVKNYPDLDPHQLPLKTVGIVMAGNIPLVGFQDALCVFVAGFPSKIKLSDKDKLLLPYLVELLCEINPLCANYFTFIERLVDFQAVIATGSNNTSRYFEAYFSKYPHIIRNNRNSVAILDGSETDEEIIALGHDIFDYFGLGCRNVTKIYVPKGYDFNHFLEVLHDEYKEMVLHDKYKNNFDYNYALFMLNRIPLFNNGCVILREEPVLASRIASLHYEFYSDLEVLSLDLAQKSVQIQCLVSKNKIPSFKNIPFGGSQKPTLSDYPDDVDVMKWLMDV